MKIFWIILAAALGVVAIYFVIVADYEKAFVAAAAGAVCWFLNYRQQIKESLRREDESKDDESDEEIRT
ncbi:MAG TPA: hypothetical protein VFB70_18255 [Pyrinomonadaceae bacterium]|nr:hypothetical protein [Pyrinomonadaceae bacterium]